MSPLVIPVLDNFFQALVCDSQIPGLLSRIGIALRAERRLASTRMASAANGFTKTASQYIRVRTLKLRYQPRLSKRAPAETPKSSYCSGLTCTAADADQAFMFFHDPAAHPEASPVPRSPCVVTNGSKSSLRFFRRDAYAVIGNHDSQARQTSVTPLV